MTPGLPGKLSEFLPHNPGPIVRYPPSFANDNLSESVA